MSIEGASNREWDYYVMPGFIARVDKADSNEIEVQDATSGKWEKNTQVAFKHFLRQGELVSQSEAQETMNFFRSNVVSKEIPRPGSDS